MSSSLPEAQEEPSSRRRSGTPRALTGLGVVLALAGIAGAVLFTAAALATPGTLQAIDRSKQTAAAAFPPRPTPLVPINALPLDLSPLPREARGDGLSDKQRLRQWLIDLADREHGRLTPAQLSTLKALIEPRFDELDEQRKRRAGQEHGHGDFVDGATVLADSTLEVKLLAGDARAHWILADGRSVVAPDRSEPNAGLIDPLTADWPLTYPRGLAELREPTIAAGALAVVEAIVALWLASIGIRMLRGSASAPRDAVRGAALCTVVIAAVGLWLYWTFTRWPPDGVAEMHGAPAANPFLLAGSTLLAVQLLIVAITWSTCRSRAVETWSLAHGYPVRLRFRRPKPKSADDLLDRFTRSSFLTDIDRR